MMMIGRGGGSGRRICVIRIRITTSIRIISTTTDVVVGRDS